MITDHSSFSPTKVFHPLTSPPRLRPGYLVCRPGVCPFLLLHLSTNIDLHPPPPLLPPSSSSCWRRRVLCTPYCSSILAPSTTHPGVIYHITSRSHIPHLLKLTPYICRRSIFFLFRGGSSICLLRPLSHVWSRLLAPTTYNDKELTRTLVLSAESRPLSRWFILDSYHDDHEYESRRNQDYMIFSSQQT